MSTKTIDRIRKLLNLADCDGASENEADTAKKIAERLMAAAGLTTADIAEQNEVDPVSTFRAEFHATGGRTAVSWVGIVAMAVSRITGCFCHWHTDVHGHKGLNWVGTNAQREAAIELFPWVVGQVNRLSKGAAKSAKGSGVNAKAWLNAYRVGVANSLGTQARELVAARTQTAATATPEGLVRVSALDNALKAYRASANLSAKKVPPVNGAAYAAGQSDGNSVRLRHDIGGSGALRLGTGTGSVA